MISKLKSHSLYSTILKDGDIVLSRIKVRPTDLTLPDDCDLDEFEYYIHESGFSLMYFMKWCEQLDLALSLLSNFNYKDKMSRADHFIYNVENYMIRVMTVYDRLLQTTNSIFHLCNSDDIVINQTILNNIKVSRDPIVKHLRKLHKYLMNNFGQKRNTLIHQYSYRDKEMRSIEVMYSHNFENYAPEHHKQLKSIRAKFLTDAIKNKKELFKETNKMLSDLILPVLDCLHEEYVKQKKRLQLIVYSRIKFGDIKNNQCRFLFLGVVHL